MAITEPETQVPIAENPLIGAPRTGNGRALFAGKCSHTVDSQGRVQFPSRWKVRAGDTELLGVLVEHRGTKASFILVLNWDQFDQLTAGVLTGPFTDMEALARRHDVAERVLPIELDAQGRFFVPAELRRAIGVKKDVELIGSIDRFEIWAPETYAAARVEEKDFLSKQNRPANL